MESQLLPQHDHNFTYIYSNRTMSRPLCEPKNSLSGGEISSDVDRYKKASTFN